MRTIEKILDKAGITKAQLKDYKNLGIVNGCGGDGGFDFSGFAKHTITYFKKFNTEKHRQFIDDLAYICYLHDLDYTLWDSILEKIKADFKLAKRLYELLNWTSKKDKFLASTSVFLCVVIWGNKFYKNRKKYELRKLITKK